MCVCVCDDQWSEVSRKKCVTRSGLEMPLAIKPIHLGRKKKKKNGSTTLRVLYIRARLYRMYAVLSTKAKSVSRPWNREI